MPRQPPVEPRPKNRHAAVCWNRGTNPRCGIVGFAWALALATCLLVPKHALAAPPTLSKDSGLVHDWMVAKKLSTNRVTRLYVEVDSLRGELDKLKLDVNVKSVSDDTDARRVQQLEVPVDAKKGVYPFELRLYVSRTLRFEDGSIKDDVGNLLINCDYSFSPTVEVYGFGERFVDSYMSIASRYEVGVGCRPLTWVIGAPTIEGAVADPSITSALLARNPPAGVAKALKKLEASRTDIVSFLESDEAAVIVDLAFSVFEETEQSEIKVKVFEGDTLVAANGTRTATPTERILRPPATARYRAVLRPRLVARITDKIEVRAQTYLKFAWPFEPYRQNGEYDWRADTSVGVVFDIDKEEKVRIEARFEQWFDNAPPGGVLQLSNGSRQVLTAEERHNRVSFIVSFKAK